MNIRFLVDPGRGKEILLRTLVVSGVGNRQSHLRRCLRVLSAVTDGEKCLTGLRREVGGLLVEHGPFGKDAAVIG